MSVLLSKKCVPCEGGLQPFSMQQATALLKDVPGWEIAPSAASIARRWKFKNFVQAIDFVNKVGEIAEKEGHHPDIKLGWGYAEIQLYTHAINGLHENDFIVAAKINAIQP